MISQVLDQILPIVPYDSTYDGVEKSYLVEKTYDIVYDFRQSYDVIEQYPLLAYNIVGCKT